MGGGSQPGTHIRYQRRALSSTQFCVYVVSRKRSSSTLKVERGLHTEGSEHAQHKIGRNILSVPVENGRNTRPRSASESGNLVMSQAPLFYDLDYLVVQVTTNLNFESVRGRKSKRCRKLSGIASDG